MADKARRRRVAGCFVAACMGLAMLWFLTAILRPEDPNAALARTTERAVEAAERAHRDATAARRTSSALRIIAVAAGVTVPLVVVYLICRSADEEDMKPEEIWEIMERHGFIETDWNATELEENNQKLIDGE
ncbi:MAG: hypothetical protein ACLFWL_18235 [Candidatus Brocadiia bacterium]